MKKRGSSCDYTAAKNEELVRVFRRLLVAARMINLDEIFRGVSEHPASRFYISEERAYELIKHHDLTGDWHIRNPLRVEMLEEISFIAARERRLHPGMSLREAVYAAVNHRAPKFYLTPRSCRTLIYAAIKRSCVERSVMRSISSSGCHFG